MGEWVSGDVYLYYCRYTPFTQKIKKMIDEGAVGDVISVQHLEPVGYWHAAHSYLLDFNYI